jgi:ATP-dependent Lon protease
MSEALEQVAGMEYIPIFPLPLVLMPYEMLPLHIFEPRYQQMLKDVELRSNMFGINFLEAQTEFETRPEPGSIGGVAMIRDAQTMPDERSNILTFGLIRYEILSYVDVGTTYEAAAVRFFEDESEDEAVLTPIADEVYDLFERVAKAAFKLSGSRGNFPEVPPAKPEQLSFLVAAAFTLDNEIKSKLLRMNRTSERLEDLKDLLLQAVAQMESNAEIVGAAKTNGHSKKPIDLPE